MKKETGISGVVVTGGSSGIGRCFIDLLGRIESAVPVCNLSRTKPVFEGEINSFLHIPCDLGKPAEVENAAGKVLEWAARLPPGEVWLLNNSGFGGYGHFPQPNLEHNLEMIDVNARGAVQLTGLLLPEWKRRGGAIGNVASTAAFQPTAYLAVYGATKAFLLHWSLGLREELRGTGVSVTAICPGPTSTDFFLRAGFKGPVVKSWLGHEAEAVAEFTYDAMRKGKPLAVPGLLNKTMAFVSTKLPKAATASFAARILRRYRLKDR